MSQNVIRKLPAYGAAAAQLGTFEEAIREIDRMANQKPPMGLPAGCYVELVEGECPAGREQRFNSFTSALRWFLQKQGYLN